MNVNNDNENLKQLLAVKDEKIIAQEKEIQALKDRIKQLLQDLYGKKSEKNVIVAPEEPPIFDEPNLTPEEQAAAEEVEAAITVRGHMRKKGASSGVSIERKLPEDLPRIIEEYDLSEVEKICSCGACMHPMGDERSERLDLIPQKIQVIITIRKKYACRSCTDGIKTAKSPPVLLPKSIVSPSLLAHVIIAKYEDHLPLYRQESMWQRLGLDLGRSTFCNWILKSAEAFAPLIPVLETELLLQGYIQVDETPVQIMEINKIRMSKTAYMWVIYSGPYPMKGVVYHFALNRSAENPQVFFENYSGFLQTDAYSSYDETKKKADITGLGCWAHARRNFVNIVKMTKKPGAAHVAVATIADLYKIEKEISPDATYDEIVQIRLKQAKPILDKFYHWLKEKQPVVIPKGPLGKAIHYVLNRWDQFTAYLKDGRLKIDNNECENIIRPFAIGRKNWLFMGNERGGKAAAILYSLINTCKLNKINTYDYLMYLITEFPKIDSKNTDELKNLLPQYYIPKKDLSA